MNASPDSDMRYHFRIRNNNRDGAASTPTDQAESEVNCEIRQTRKPVGGGSLTFPEWPKR